MKFPKVPSQPKSKSKSPKYFIVDKEVISAVEDGVICRFDMIWYIYLECEGQYFVNKNTRY